MHTKQEMRADDRYAYKWLHKIDGITFYRQAYAIAFHRTVHGIFCKTNRWNHIPLCCLSHRTSPQTETKMNRQAGLRIPRTPLRQRTKRSGFPSILQNPKLISQAPSFCSTRIEKLPKTIYCIDKPLHLDSSCFCIFSPAYKNFQLK